MSTDSDDPPNPDILKYAATNPRKSAKPVKISVQGPKGYLSEHRDGSRGGTLELYVENIAHATAKNSCSTHAVDPVIAPRCKRMTISVTVGIKQQLRNQLTVNGGQNGIGRRIGDKLGKNGDIGKDGTRIIKFTAYKDKHWDLEMCLVLPVQCSMLLNKAKMYQFAGTEEAPLRSFSFYEGNANSALSPAAGGEDVHPISQGCQEA
ncbi:hypothetical protein BDW62DRAFT_203419 [Aspergillus aurantiobrunneus]